MLIKATLFFGIAGATSPLYAATSPLDQSTQNPHQPLHCELPSNRECALTPLCHQASFQGYKYHYSLGPAYFYTQVGNGNFKLPEAAQLRVTPESDPGACSDFDAAVAFEALRANHTITQELLLDPPIGECERKLGKDTCLWVKVAYTKFRLFSESELCNREGQPSSVDVRYPNIGNEKGEFYCRRGIDACSNDSKNACWADLFGEEDFNS